jgi:hypothetical protein
MSLVEGRVLNFALFTAGEAACIPQALWRNTSLEIARCGRFVTSPVTALGGTHFMSPDEVQRRARLEGIFMPFARQRRESLFGPISDLKAPRFVHYTSAEAALSIIRSKGIWLRNAKCMDDYSEVELGYKMLRDALLDAETDQKFRSCLDGIGAGIAQRVIDLFHHVSSDISLNTYLASLSEHDDSENQHGRLSMWRAFGGSAARVAIVIKFPLLSGVTDHLQLSLAPVAYMNEAEVKNNLLQVIQNIAAEIQFLRTVGVEEVNRWLFTMLWTAAAATKHRGFHEEREWRAILYPYRPTPDLVETSLEVVRGVPQLVAKVPLDGAIPDLGSIDLANILDRLIIGPTPYPWPIYRAFAHELSNRGIPNAEEKVWVSGIPLRS